MAGIQISEIEPGRVLGKFLFNRNLVSRIESPVLRSRDPEYFRSKNGTLFPDRIRFCKHSFSMTGMKTPMHNLVDVSRELCQILNLAGETL